MFVAGPPGRKLGKLYSPAAVGTVIFRFHIHIYSLMLTNCMKLLLSFAVNLLVTQNKFYLLLMEQRK